MSRPRPTAPRNAKTTPFASLNQLCREEIGPSADRSLPKTVTPPQLRPAQTPISQMPPFECRDSMIMSSLELVKNVRFEAISCKGGSAIGNIIDERQRADEEDGF